jgi:deoxyribodipyrimidine photolyase-related protein
LYWDFIARHPQVFEGNPRMAWSSHQWQKMSNDDQAAVRQQAAHWLGRLDDL